MGTKCLVLLAAALLLVNLGFCQTFELELFTDSVQEGERISYNLSINDPQLSNVTVEQRFRGPNGKTADFRLPSSDRDRWPSPSISPATGTVNGSEKLELRRVRGETSFEWRTPLNGRIDKEVYDEEELGNWTLLVTVSAVDFDQGKIVEKTLQADFNVTKMHAKKNPKFVVLTLSVLTSLFTTLASYFMVDQKRARALKKKVSAMQKEIMDAQKSGDKKKIAKSKQKQSQMMSLQGEMMRNQFKPMIIYMIPLFAVFYFLRAQYDLIPVVELPFRLGFLQFFHQNNPISPDQFGFLAWYFSCATLFGSIFRKIIGVV